MPLTLSSLREKSDRIAGSYEDLLIRAEDVAASVLIGGHRKRLPGYGDEFWQFREFQSLSDQPQDIDWRQSAKGERHYIRQKEQQVVQRFHFWLSRYEGMNYKSDIAPCSKAEMAQLILMALGVVLSRSGEYLSSPFRNRASRGEPGLERLGAYLLNGAEGQQESGSAAILPGPGEAESATHTSRILAGDFLAPAEDIEACLERLAGQGQNGLILQVLDPAEEDLPFDGHVLFEGVEHNESIRIDHAQSIRSKYQERVKAHCRNVAEIAESYGWLYLKFRTDMPPAHAFEKLWLLLQSLNERQGL